VDGPLRFASSRQRAGVTSDALTHVTSGHVIRSITPGRKSNGRSRRNRSAGARMGVAWTATDYIRRRHASAAASAMMMRSSSSASASSSLSSLPLWINCAFRYSSSRRALIVLRNAHSRPISLQKLTAFYLTIQLKHV